MRYFITFLILISANTFADGLDYSSDFGFRSRPLGASIGVQSGYSKLIWSDYDQNAEKKPFLYGYIRPNSRIATSAVVNKFSGNIDIMPISIFGFTFGYTATHRGIDAKKIDCQLNECGGWTHKKTAKLQAVIGTLDFFVLSKVGIEFTEHANTTKDFTDEFHVLLAKKDGDKLITNETLAGYILNKDWRMGLLYMSAKFLGTGQSNGQYYIFSKNNIDEKWSIISGAGTYHSTNFVRDFAFFTQLTWTGIPKIGFF